MDFNDNYFEVNFHVSPLDDGRDILLAILSEQQFESFLETEKGLRAYVKQGDWDFIDIERALSLIPSAFEVSYHTKEIHLQILIAQWE
jgi:ribosomal protein L11 methyltransferase